jgi:hypothetical protein
MREYITSYEFVSMLALFTYWIPLAICLSVYFFRTIKLYRLDLSNCNDKFYTPTLTIGLIVWMFLLAITPAINLFALVFDCAGSVFKWLGKSLNIPLVKKQHSNNS